MVLFTEYLLKQKAKFCDFNAQKSGFSLVELLVYITVFAIAAIGISSMYMTLQKHHVEVRQYGEYEGQKDFAHNLLKVSLKNANSVSISDVDVNDSACLQLNNEYSTQRTGIKFNGAGRMIESMLPINITDAQARSISFWVKAETGQADENVILRWGETSGRQFAIILRNGHLYVQMEGALLGSYNGIDFFDNNWHHVAITFPDSTTSTVINGGILKQYIDGVRRDGNKREDPFGVGRNYLMRTTASKLLVGARDKNATNSFKGSLSDLRIWSDVLEASDVTRIFNEAPGHETILHWSQVLHWPLFDLGSTQQTTIVDFSGQNNLGMLNNFDSGMLVSFGNKKHQTSQKFCFFDTDSDNLFELWQGVGDTPQNPTGNNAWQLKTKDVFVPGADGFFKNVGLSPETVTANFAIGTAAGSDVTVLQKNVTSSFSNNIIAPAQALCAVTPSDVFVAPGCNVNQVLASVVDGFDPKNDTLTITAKSKQKMAMFTIYSRIENLPPTVNAVWNQLDGIMRFYTLDYRPLPTQVWNRAMRSVRFESSGTDYSTTKKIVFSMGEAAFEIDGKFHFYDFVQHNGQPYSFNTALSRAHQSEPKMCGLQPYLMTITSPEENYFIDQNFKANAYHGWIGARETEPGGWRWINGPDNGTRFWYGNGAGIPIIDDGTADGEATNLLVYRKPADNVVNIRENEMAPLWIKNNDTLNMRYSNFSLGQTGQNVSEFEPRNNVSYSTSPAKYLFINRSLRGAGLWRSAPLNAAYCQSPTPNHEFICGHYREWGGMPNDPAIKSASSVTIDMEIHNKYCKTTP
ncbi:LamG domain-containing protein [Alphaproteobacteria bacterium]|nr:LamG domain-containing protein [Alphaproteobacteria bacterium]